MIQLIEYAAVFVDHQHVTIPACLNRRSLRDREWPWIALVAILNVVDRDGGLRPRYYHIRNPIIGIRAKIGVQERIAALIDAGNIFRRIWINWIGGNVLVPGVVRGENPATFNSWPDGFTRACSGGRCFQVRQ